MFDLQKGKQTAIHEFQHDGTQQITFSPDRRFLASAGKRGILKVWTLDGPQIPVEISLGSRGSTATRL